MARARPVRRGAYSEADVLSNVVPTPSKKMAQVKHRTSDAPLRQKALRTKDHLISVARSLILTQGYAATTIDDIAEAAAVSRASFYTYFSSKREIMIIAGHESRHVGWDLFKELGDISRDNLEAGLRRWIERYFAFLEDHGGYLFMWQQASLQDSELRKLGSQGQQKAIRILCSSLLKLGTPATDVDLEIRALAIRSMLERFWYHWWISKVPYNREQVLDNLVAMMALMISAP